MMALLVVLLNADACVSVDRGVLVQAVKGYTAKDGQAAPLLAMLEPLLVPCVNISGPDPDEALYVAVQQLRPALEKRLRAGDVDAWRIGLGLRHRTDGSLLEDLTGTLSSAVAKQAAAYLRASQRVPGTGALSLPSFMGERFVDAGVGVRCRALHERLDAIAAVHETDLADIRRAALAELRPRVEQCE